MVISRAFRYYLFSRHRRGKGLSYPCVQELVREVFSDRKHYDAYRIMSRARRDYLADRSRITLHDLGAGHGNKKQKHHVRRIRDIARHSSGHPRYHRLLCRLARHYAPATVIETGTALGLGTLALALGAPQAGVFTIEGDPALADRAAMLFEKHGLRNITLLRGSFDEQLPAALHNAGSAGLVFLDGHHEEEATLRYFGMLLPYLRNESLVVVDDIHWSAGMLRAWDILRHHEKVSLSVNLFRMGILFFDPALKKETLVVRY